ncbi:MAG: sensor histidine kinase [Gemmataceae bacterium]
MNTWLQGKRRGLIVFLLIAVLVAGGLGWVTSAALRLEADQVEARAKAEADATLRLAMWRLQSRLAPAFAREESRPYNQYTAISPPSLLVTKEGRTVPPGSVLEPSPLLSADLPDWMLLHFQMDDKGVWASPQVLSESLRTRLADKLVSASLVNATPVRARLLADLSCQVPLATVLLNDVRARSTLEAVKDTALVSAQNLSDNSYGMNGSAIAPNSPAQAQNANGNDYANRVGQQARVQRELSGNSIVNDRNALGNLDRNGENWLTPSSPKKSQGVSVEINVGSMVPVWLPGGATDRLLLVRLVRVGSKEICQGVVLDVAKLQTLLADEVSDLFPEARIVPVRQEDEVNPDRVMTALPLQLDPGPSTLAVADWQWTPLRVGLLLAWIAALAALLAVGLGGWSLLDLSERRIRFVSAVTHELRTPLTTLRLYLDMLTGGMVKEEAQRTEYLHTLNAETDRLNRLVANVLDFSRLENQRPVLHKSEIAVADMLEHTRATWQGRCDDAGKELIIENFAEKEDRFVSDKELVQQILGNLIDNACKYSRSAEDRRLWLRARNESGSRLIFEVEDRGPGVARQESRTIFRPFRRGGTADVTAGGVGLGLALASRWAGLLGGRLSVGSGAQGLGACFRLELPRRQ